MRKIGPPFYTKRGWLTVYGLRCGYIQQKEVDGSTVELYHEGAVYQVRQFKKDGTRLLWESFDDDDLAGARSLFQSIKPSNTSE